MSKPTVDRECYYESITLHIEDSLMRVPRVIFQDSVVFQNMFTMPQGEGTIADGNDDQHPLKLVSVSTADFKLFLPVAIAHAFRVGMPQLDTHSWMAVLRLVTMWDMEALKQELLKILGKQFDESTAAYQVHLALEHRIEDWVPTGLKRLVERNSPLLTSEMSLLGFNTSAKVAALREEHRQAAFVADKQEQSQNMFKAIDSCTATSCHCTLHKWAGPKPRMPPSIDLSGRCASITLSEPFNIDTAAASFSASPPASFAGWWHGIRRK